MPCGSNEALPFCLKFVMHALLQEVDFTIIVVWVEAEDGGLPEQYQVPDGDVCTGCTYGLDHLKYMCSFEEGKRMCRESETFKHKVVFLGQVARGQVEQYVSDSAHNVSIFKITGNKLCYIFNGFTLEQFKAANKDSALGPLPTDHNIEPVPEVNPLSRQPEDVYYVPNAPLYQRIIEVTDRCTHQDQVMQMESYSDEHVDQTKGRRASVMPSAEVSQILLRSLSHQHTVEAAEATAATQAAERQQAAQQQMGMMSPVSPRPALPAMIPSIAKGMGPVIPGIVAPGMGGRFVGSGPGCSPGGSSSGLGPSPQSGALSWPQGPPATRLLPATKPSAAFAGLLRPRLGVLQLERPLRPPPVPAFSQQNGTGLAAVAAGAAGFPAGVEAGIMDLLPPPPKASKLEASEASRVLAPEPEAAESKAPSTEPAAGAQEPQIAIEMKPLKQVQKIENTENRGESAEVVAEVQTLQSTGLDHRITE